MFEWVLSNTQWLLLGLVCVALIVIATVLSSIRRREVIRLREEVEELSGRVNALEIIEQRRFLVELKSKGKAPAVAPTAEIVPLPEGGTSQQPPAA
jgi:hypothetical protein